LENSYDLVQFCYPLSHRRMQGNVEKETSKMIIVKPDECSKPYKK
jgi:hypothetical protein